MILKEFKEQLNNFDDNLEVCIVHRSLAESVKNIYTILANKATYNAYNPSKQEILVLTTDYLK